MILNNKYKPGVYFAATVIATYVLWFAGAYLSFQDDESGLYMLLMLPGLMAPFLISLIMIFTSKNPDLKKDFINRLTNLRLIQPNNTAGIFLNNAVLCPGFYPAFASFRGFGLAVPACRRFLFFNRLCPCTISSYACCRF